MRVLATNSGEKVTFFPTETQYKFKIAILGSVESIKKAFQEQISDVSMPSPNKQVIGVNISGIHSRDYGMASQAYMSVWDISCDERFASLRPTYYRGSEAIIVLLDENTLPQLGDYFAEIVERNSRISLNFVVCVEQLSGKDVWEYVIDGNLFQEGRFEFLEAQHSRDIIEWVFEKFECKVKTGVKRDNFAVSVLRRGSLVRGNAGSCPTEVHQYCTPPDNFDELNPSTRVDVEAVRLYLERGGFSVDERDGSVRLDNRFGTWQVFLDDASVYLTPRRCSNCKNKCRKQRSYICIIAASRGFSNLDNFKQGELLVLAKVFAIENEAFPNHVLNQIKKASKCAFPKKM
ncbi:MAG: hypothetical protein ACTSU5_07705 [Promethearchaeota archaeon]